MAHAHNSSSKRSRIAFGIAILICGITAGWLLKGTAGQRQIASDQQITRVRKNSPAYKFINPLLFIENPKDSSPEYENLRKAIGSSVAAIASSHAADSISVYFKDLNSGRWTGVNEDAKYEPSSMLKVALLIADLKIAEGNTDFLLKEVPYTHGQDSVQYYQPAKKLPEGSYAIHQLLESMIIDSDNDAANALFKDNPNGFDELYRDLHLPNPPQDMSDFMSARSYSVLFRTLYNSSYLSWPVSEKALDLLSLTNFKKGLVAGLPKDTRISHKFGENTTIFPDGQSEQRELHDCGIVYYPEAPYFICVMTRGTDFAKLESAIASVSKSVYDFRGSMKK
ncbi:MAG: hypothetical protein JWO73_239 [Candidatus Taylorbacteria bacterium]|nr:hypothetical protein [Candidatus Taylorbacteria bacterium]